MSREKVVAGIIALTSLALVVFGRHWALGAGGMLISLIWIWNARRERA